MFKEIARIMMNSVVGNCLNDKRDFKVALTGSSSEYIATLYPQQKQMKMLFHKTRSVVTRVELIEKKGDRTIIELKNIKTNAAINTKVFQVN